MQNLLQMPKKKVIERVLKVCKRNSDSRNVLLEACNFQNSEYNKLDAPELLYNEISIFELVEAFGAMNIDIEIFDKIDIVIDKCAAEKDVLKVKKNYTK